MEPQCRGEDKVLMRESWGRFGCGSSQTARVVSDNTATGYPTSSRPESGLNTLSAVTTERTYVSDPIHGTKSSLSQGSVIGTRRAFRPTHIDRSYLSEKP